MAMYQLNMARDQVLTLKKRRQWFHWMFAYLILSIAVVAGVAHWLTVSIVELSAQRRAMDGREKVFLSQRSGVQGLEGCLKKVTSEMEGLTSSFEALMQFRAKGQKSAAIVLGFAESLPQGLDLGHLMLDCDGGIVKVDVYVPASLKLNDGLTLPNVIAHWEGSPLLANRIREIASENSSRVSFEGRDYLCWRFTGTLERGNQ